MTGRDDAAAGATGRLAETEGKIAEAARTAGRTPGDVQLIAVSKTFGAPEIEPLLRAGHKRFGENRVQEAKGKWPALKAQFPDVALHLIGPLQSNKVKEAVELFDAIHSIDREKIARAVAAEMKRQGKRLELFIQVNTGEEPQKAGVLPRDTAALLKLCREELGLEIAGLMCIPPVDEEPALHFAFLAKLAGELGLRGLSMGMSDDFETAIAFGATHVRVGSAIFGSRAIP
jgi:pyridoxal phosphate enzyme (YggS family)